jgi:hypothetical protein
MGWLIGAVLFLLPFLAYAGWARLAGRRLEPSRGLLLLAFLGVLMAAAGFVWYGLDRGMPRGTVYVPARLAPDGSLIPGHGDPAAR